MAKGKRKGISVGFSEVRSADSFSPIEGKENFATVFQYGAQINQF